MGFPGGSDSKEFAFNAGDLGLIPESGGSPGEGNGYPLQYSCLGNPWTKVPGGPSSMGLQRVRLNWVTDTFIFSWFHRIGVFIRRITTELTLPSLLLFFFFSFSPHAHTNRSTWELTVRWWPLTSQEEMCENETFLAGNLILDFQPLEIWELDFCCLSHSVCSTALWQPK